MDAIDFDCPNCGKRFELTRDYLSAYGGQITECDACHRDFSLPPVSVLPQLEETKLQYASPEVPLTRGVGAWRLGAFLVLRRTGSLPRRCIKCNGAVTIYRQLDFKIVSGLSRFSGLSAAATAEYVSIKAGLCRRHDRQLQVRLYGGWLMLLFALVLIVLGPIATDYYRPAILLSPLGVTLGLAAAAWIKFFRRIINLLDADRSYLTFSGCSPDYLQTLPDYEIAQGVSREEEARKLENLTN